MHAVACIQQFEMLINFFWLPEKVPDVTEYSGPGVIPINCLSKEIKLIKDIQKNKYSADGAFEGLNHEDEISANTLLNKHISRDKSGWQYSKEKKELDSGTWQRNLFILHAQKTMANIEKKILWWNSCKMKLPRNYIPRRILEFYYHFPTHHFLTGNLFDLCKSTRISVEFLTLLHQNKLMTESEYHATKNHGVRLFQ